VLEVSCSVVFLWDMRRFRKSTTLLRLAKYLFTMCITWLSFFICIDEKPKGSKLRPSKNTWRQS
jgi:hypothetical protein